ncbi:hypothetical protein Sjap_024552 [Stephania japonica]|uniref:Uncharacterized protein n=1 Tax=Stephania japonica TaxID=461633 RepID=A0AAP0EDL0_9MAGN
MMELSLELLRSQPEVRGNIPSHASPIHQVISCFLPSNKDMKKKMIANMTAVTTENGLKKYDPELVGESINVGSNSFVGTHE